MSDSSRSHGLQPTRLLCPWDFPGKSTGVGLPLPSPSTISRLKQMEEIHKFYMYCELLHVHVVYFNCTGEMSDVEMAPNILTLMYMNALQMQI